MPFLPNKLKDGIVTLQLTRQESYLRVTKLVEIEICKSLVHKKPSRLREGEKRKGLQASYLGLRARARTKNGARQASNSSTTQSPKRP